MFWYVGWEGDDFGIECFVEIEGSIGVNVGVICNDLLFSSGMLDYFDCMVML